MAIKKSKKTKKTKGKVDSSDASCPLATALAAKYGGMRIYTKENPCPVVEKWSTGIIELDDLLEGGIPKGRIIEVFGAESSGKTSFTLSLAVEVQNSGGKVCIVDAERALDINYCKAIGIDEGKTLILEPENGEDALNAMRDVVESGLYDLVVFDSTGALISKSEIEGDVGDSHTAKPAKLMNDFLKSANGFIRNTGTTVVFISQERANISFGGMGPSKKQTGGNAIKFFTSVRIQIIRTGSFPNKENALGNIVKVVAVKNKTGGKQFASTETNVRFGMGYCKYYDLIDIAVKEGILQKNGAWIAYNNGQLAQGKENARTRMIQEPELFKEIKEKVFTQRKIRAKEEADRIAGVSIPEVEDDNGVKSVEKQIGEDKLGWSTP